jgi:hypothetical protein
MKFLIITSYLLILTAILFTILWIPNKFCFHHQNKNYYSINGKNYDFSTLKHLGNIESYKGSDVSQMFYPTLFWNESCPGIEYPGLWDNLLNRQNNGFSHNISIQSFSNFEVGYKLLDTTNLINGTIVIYNKVYNTLPYFNSTNRFFDGNLEIIFNEYGNESGNKKNATIVYISLLLQNKTFYSNVLSCMDNTILLGILQEGCLLKDVLYLSITIILALLFVVFTFLPYVNKSCWTRIKKTRTSSIGIIELIKTPFLFAKEKLCFSELTRESGASQSPTNHNVLYTTILTDKTTNLDNVKLHSNGFPVSNVIITDLNNGLVSKLLQLAFNEIRLPTRTMIHQGFVVQIYSGPKSIVISASRNDYKLPFIPFWLQFVLDNIKNTEELVANSSRLITQAEYTFQSKIFYKQNIPPITAPLFVVKEIVEPFRPYQYMIYNNNSTIPPASYILSSTNQTIFIEKSNHSMLFNHFLRSSNNQGYTHKSTSELIIYNLENQSNSSRKLVFYDKTDNTLHNESFIDPRCIAITQLVLPGLIIPFLPFLMLYSLNYSSIIFSAFFVNVVIINVFNYVSISLSNFCNLIFSFAFICLISPIVILYQLIIFVYRIIWKKKNQQQSDDEKKTFLEWKSELNYDTLPSTISNYNTNSSLGSVLDMYYDWNNNK